MTNKLEATPAPAPSPTEAPSQVVKHPDDVAAEIIALAASRGYGISTEGFTPRTVPGTLACRKAERRFRT